MGKRRIMKLDSGFAAAGILMTVTQKRRDDSARGSFLGKELPTGVRLAEGPKGPETSLRRFQ